MIKTYDEALKILNDIRTYLAIGRADDCVQELDKVARYFINEKQKEQSNFEQCIKEWEERGYRISKDLFIDKCGMINNSKNYIYITLKESQIKCGIDGWITLEELNLLYKTLKALEEIKDE